MPNLAARSEKPATEISSVSDRATAFKCSRSGSNILVTSGVETNTAPCETLSRISEVASFKFRAMSVDERNCTMPALNFISSPITHLARLLRLAHKYHHSRQH